MRSAHTQGPQRGTSPDPVIRLTESVGSADMGHKGSGAPGVTRTKPPPPPPLVFGADYALMY